MSYYKAETVREAASGNWLFIVSALAPHAEEALKRLDVSPKGPSPARRSRMRNASRSSCP